MTDIPLNTGHNVDNQIHLEFIANKHKRRRLQKKIAPNFSPATAVNTSPTNISEIQEDDSKLNISDHAEAAANADPEPLDNLDTANQPPDSTVIPDTVASLTHNFPETWENHLAESLCASGKITTTDIERIQRLATESADPWHKLLVHMGLIAERDLAQNLASLLGLPMATIKDYPELPIENLSISLRFMQDNHILPLTQNEQELSIAIADPTDNFSIQAIQLASGLPVTVKVGIAEEISAAVERLYGEGQSAMKGIADGLDGSDNSNEDDIESLKELASEAPIIRLVNLVMQRAVDNRASDIHIEPFAGQLKVRYRIDGVLQEVEAPPTRSTAAIISRIKIMAKLNIAERRLPQDGRIPLRIQGKELDLRVSTVPTMHGESVVMRLLDKASVKFDLDALGFDGVPRERLLTILERPHGMVLVTGPTGSGKSTTLYTALSRINKPGSKIITVEDPVEYQLNGINQIQVRPQIGMSFANALRAIVRQDPDIIMIGEMRDLETARIAVQSALTGHLVLSTLHTNDASGGISRLMDMGVENFLLASTINGIIGQRLVRRLCDYCKQEYLPKPEIKEKLRSALGKIVGENEHIFAARGCVNCSNTGYYGRLAIAEVLIVSDNMRQVMLKQVTATDIQRVARREGMHTMYEDGMRKVVAGLTTLEEVIRVTQSDDISDII